MIAPAPRTFDIGRFELAQTQPTPDQVLEFVAKITDYDGDTDTAPFDIGIDGAGTYNDGSVIGV